MAKVKTHQVNQKEKYRIIGEFFDITASLKTKKEVIDFFIGLITPSEMLMFARRIQVAEMLIEEKGYDEIRQELKVSFQTIAKVYYWLHGENDGFNKQIKQQIKRKRIQGITKTYKNSLLDRYPGHRLLKSILE